MELGGPKFTITARRKKDGPGFTTATVGLLLAACVGCFGIGLLIGWFLPVIILSDHLRFAACSAESHATGSSFIVLILRGAYSHVSMLLTSLQHTAAVCCSFFACMQTHLLAVTNAVAP